MLIIASSSFIFLFFLELLLCRSFVRGTMSFMILFLIAFIIYDFVFDNLFMSNFVFLLHSSLRLWINWSRSVSLYYRSNKSGLRSSFRTRSWTTSWHHRRSSHLTLWSLRKMVNLLVRFRRDQSFKLVSIHLIFRAESFKHPSLI